MSEEVDQVSAFELALALKKLVDHANEALPSPKQGVELAKANKQIYHKLLASKIFHGYQLEFVMNSGEVHYGFVIGLDDYCVQIYATGWGESFRQNIEYAKEFYELKDGFPTRHWLGLSNIESTNENFFGTRHLTKDAQTALEAERRAVVQIAKRFLYPRDEEKRA